MYQNFNGQWIWYSYPRKGQRIMISFSPVACMKVYVYFYTTLVACTDANCISLKYENSLMTLSLMP